MRTVTLQFPNLQLLWAFVQTLTSHDLEINTKNRTLLCSCTETEIADALATYKAKALDIKPVKL